MWLKVASQLVGLLVGLSFEPSCLLLYARGRQTKQLGSNESHMSLNLGKTQRCNLLLSQKLGTCTNRVDVSTLQAM